MRRGRTLILVVLVLIIGLAVVGFVFFQSSQNSAKQQANEPVYVKIYSASQDIAQGEPITEEKLTTINIPQDKVTASEFTEAEKTILLDNKIALYPLKQGVVITETMVVDASSSVPVASSEWAARIPMGMTAMTLPTNRLALAGYGASDGARVNVNACFLFVDVDPSFQTSLPNWFDRVYGTGFNKEGYAEMSTGILPPARGVAGRAELDAALQQPFYYIPSEAQRPRVVCQTLAQDVTVLHMGNFSLPTAADAAQAAAPATDQTKNQQTPPDTTSTQANKRPDIVTLLVTPQDALILTYTIYTNAQVTLTLRNAGDRGKVVTEAATLQFLLSQYNIPVPAKLPYALHPAVPQLLSPSLPNDVIEIEPKK